MLKMPSVSRSMLRQALRNLEAQGYISKIRGNRWALAAKDQQMEGRLSVNPKGFGWIDFPQPDKPSLFIPPRHLGVALHGDLVQVRQVSGGDGAREGRIVRVVERGRKQLAGLLKRTQYYWYVIPDDPRIPQDVRLAGTPPAKDQENQKVVVKLDLPKANAVEKELLTGRIIEYLGHQDDPGVDMLCVMRNHSLYEAFPERIEDASRAFSRIPDDADRKGRRDLRDRLVFSIDPSDAKDIDDAVSFERLSGNRIRLGIHIADVSHYVEKGSIMDREAERRGNTVYLADRVVTMLPRYLTTEVCSLWADKDCLTFSLDLILDAKGKVLESEFYAGLIHSAACLHYEQVQTLIDGKGTSGMKPEICKAIKEMHALAQTLRKRRIAKGALDFHQPEVSIDLDAQGNVQGFHRREAREAYQLIEEFMLIANQTAAEKLLSHDVPAVYRIHDEPSADQWEAMGEALATLGFGGRPENREEINELVRGIENEALRPIATLCILRNLQRALYTDTCAPHFGLAFDHYTHFTSPIRRYPDLLVHRILRALENGRSAAYRRSSLERIVLHCNAMENEADMASRESIAIKRAEYYHTCLLRGEVGPFEGYVVSILSRGLIVELKETLQHGLIPFSTLHDDHYVVDEHRTSARGRRHGRVWKMGQPLRVELVSVDTARRMVDFRWRPERSNPDSKAKDKPRRRRRKDRG